MKDITIKEIYAGKPDAITEMSDESVADTIDRWIVSHSSHNLQHQE